MDEKTKRALLSVLDGITGDMDGRIGKRFSPKKPEMEMGAEDEAGELPPDENALASLKNMLNEPVPEDGEDLADLEGSTDENARRKLQMLKSKMQWSEE